MIQFVVTAPMKPSRRRGNARTEFPTVAKGTRKDLLKVTGRGPDPKTVKIWKKWHEEEKRRLEAAAATQRRGDAHDN